MPRTTSPSLRLLPDGSRLHNRLLAALPRTDYDRISQDMQMTAVTTGRTLHAPRARIKDVYFPNGGVYSVTNEMRNGPRVEVATIGREGMLGIGVFFGDRAGIGRTFQQVANGLLPSMAVAQFVRETAVPGPFRDVVNVYAQANLLSLLPFDFELFTFNFLLSRLRLARCPWKRPSTISGAWPSPAVSAGPTTLARAIDALGFVQADPIRAPARAQDLTLRPRVHGYRAGDLERLYPSLDVEEDVFVNYGFVTRSLHALMHPRPVASIWPSSRNTRAQDVLAFVRSTAPYIRETSTRTSRTAP